MEEVFDIYDVEMNHIGIASRKDVHQQGLWHQTFHCWVISDELGYRSLLFQRRHPLKDSNPGKLDVTAAGHLLSGETVEDGVRELQEELGIEVAFPDLARAGLYKEDYVSGSFVDREFCHVFIYKSDAPLHTYHLQADEVTGLYRVKLAEAMELFRGNRASIAASGFELQPDGSTIDVEMNVSVEDFVKRELDYYELALTKAEQV